MSISFLANLLLVKVDSIIFTFAIISMNSISSCGALLDHIGSTQARGLDCFDFTIEVDSRARAGGAIDRVGAGAVVDGEKSTCTSLVAGASLGHGTGAYGGVVGPLKSILHGASSP